MKKNNAPASSGEQTAQGGLFDRLFARRWVSLIVSVLLAVMLWLIVLAQEPTQTIIVTGVPVSYDYNAPLYTGASLDIMESRDLRVNVTITCDTNARGTVDKSDIIVYPDYTEVSHSGEPGKYTLRLRARRSDASLEKFEVESVSPAYVEVTFGKIDTRKFPVEAHLGLEAAEGYCLGEAQISPGEVTLRGPVEELERIDKVRARVESSTPIDRSLLNSASLDFLDAEGRVVDTARVTVQEGEQVEVSVPVLRLREVPLVFDYNNVPSGYDPSVLNATISPSTIRIAGSAETVEAVESISAGLVNVARIQLDRPETLTFSLPEGLVNYDDIKEATVTFHMSGYTTRNVTVSDIRVINEPAGVTVEVLAEQLENVQLVGRASELSELSLADVVAVIDASAKGNIMTGSGQQQLNVQIIVTGTKTVFATGSYVLPCDITVPQE